VVFAVAAYFNPPPPGGEVNAFAVVTSGGINLAVAALVRGHVAANPPLATHELAAFKLAVSVLAAVGRILARTAREAAQAGALPRDVQQELSRTRALVSDVERRMHEFARAALVTWESRVD